MMMENRRMLRNKLIDDKQEEPFFYRRVQPSGHFSYCVNLPANFVKDLQLEYGDYVKCTSDGTKIVISPAAAEAEMAKKTRRKKPGGSG
jgi:antitoxin component of MazEF toxin-antitoxin module